MMGIDPRCVIVLLAPLLLAMRDPFVPVDDPCHTAQLSLLQYAGHVDDGLRQIGFLRDEKGQWRRVERDAMLNSRWRIAEITAENLTLNLGAECDPSHWRVIKGENTNDKKDKPAGAVTAATVGSQQKRVAGGG
ncbi:HofP DNA utilization family protein [Pseudocitrobacter cyperus]|uniref:HofP DNA utilization family protein n=1 Tax=Pseudocitrobacter cyperus TaxID=3112843 RepID=A0ABV0HMX3_9ENTR